MKLKMLLPAVFLIVLLMRALGVAQVYSPAVNYSAASPRGVASGDFNEDGNVDVVAVNTGASSLAFFAGKGDGTLGAGTVIPVGTAPFDVASGDFNGDGHLDLVVTLTTSKSFQILFGNGNGTFQPAETIPITGLTQATTVGQIVVADLNHDNKPDIAIATDFGLALFINTGGSFAQFAYVDGTKLIGNIAVGDLNNDGNLDIALIELSFDANGNTIGDLYYALGNGDGTFQTLSHVFAINGSPTGLALGDVDRDGRLDIVVSNSGQVIGGGGGTPIPCTPRICPPQDLPTNPLGTTTLPGSINVLTQKTPLSFVGSFTISSDKQPGFLMVADLNGDGNPDIVDVSESSANVITFSGQGDGTFAAGVGLAIPGFGAEVIPAHLADPTALDLVVTDISANEISVFTNAGANTLSLVSSANPSLVGNTVTLTATVQPKHPGAGSLAGSVIFTDAGTTLGSAPIDRGGKATLNATFASAGAHPLVATYTGNITFVGGTSAQLSQSVRLGPPTVIITSSLNPSSYGQSVNFSISVSNAGAAVGAGDIVNLLSNNAIVASGSLDANGKVTLSSSSLPSGSDVLIAQFTGDATNSPADSSQLIQTVNKTDTNLTLTSSQNPSPFGQPVSFVTVVAPKLGNAVPSGTVTILDGSVILGTAVIDASGKAVFNFSSLTPGSHLLSASYAGDANFNPSSTSAGSTISQVVTQNSTSALLASSADPSVFGQNVVFSATIRPVTGTGIPTGSVSFNDGTTTLGVGTLDNTGQAKLAVSSLAVGSHSIRVAYSGSDGYQPVTSVALVQVVKQDAVSLLLSSTPNPSVSGGAVTIAVSVNPAVTVTNAIPTGTVSISDGTTLLGTVKLDASSKATLSIASLSVGTHSLAAYYSGDINFAAGSAAINQEVDAVVPVPNASDFTIAVKQAAATISLNAPFSTVVSVTPKNGFAGPVTLSCAGLPVAVTCSFVPSTATLNGTTALNSQLTISLASATPANQGGSSKPIYPLPRNSPLTFMAPALLGCVLTRKVRRQGAALMVLAVMMIGMSACGGSKFGDGGVHPKPGNYTISIQGVSGNVVHSTQLQLTLH